MNLRALTFPIASVPLPECDPLRNAREQRKRESTVIRRQLILTVLANAGPIEPEAIARRLGDRNYRSVRAHLVALEYAGKAERLPGGRYVVAGRMVA